MQGKGSASAGGGHKGGCREGWGSAFSSSPRASGRAAPGDAAGGGAAGSWGWHPLSGDPGGSPQLPKSGLSSTEDQKELPETRSALWRGAGGTQPPASPNSRPPLGRCPLQFHKPQGKDAAPGQPLSISPSPHMAPQPPNPKASRQPRWSRENPKADIRAWQHWAGVPGPSPRAEFRRFGEEPEQPQVTGTGDI